MRLITVKKKCCIERNAVSRSILKTFKDKARFSDRHINDMVNNTSPVIVFISKIRLETPTQTERYTIR